MPIRPDSLLRNGWVGEADGSLPPQSDTPAAASQTIKRMDFLTLTSGTVQNAISLSGTSHPASGADAGTGALTIYGVAAGDITTTGSVSDTDRVPVMRPTDATLLYLPIYHDTAGSSEPQDLTIGSAYDLVRVQLASGIGVYAANAAVSDSDSELVYQGRMGINADEDYGFGIFKIKAANLVR